MLGLFKSKRFPDPELGELVRSRGHWRGSIELGAGAREALPLALTGPRAEPDPQALTVAKQLPTLMASWRARIEEALFEHYGPYAPEPDAEAAPDSEQGIPMISEPSQVWPHVSLEYVSITPMSGALTVELGYTSAWDEEHTLGARFRSGVFVELCGSVLPA